MHTVDENACNFNNDFYLHFVHWISVSSILQSHIAPAIMPSATIAAVPKMPPAPTAAEMPAMDPSSTGILSGSILRRMFSPEPLEPIEDGQNTETDTSLYDYENAKMTSSHG